MARISPRWEVGPRDFDFETKMARALAVHPAVAGVLRRRGIDTIEAAEAFLHPPLSALHDPFDLPDMPAAADRLVQAIERKETVMVHGDYDVDGITAAALMVRFLSKLGADVQYFIPHRQRDHYGLSINAVRQAAEGGAHLAVAVDCGVTAIEAIAEAGRAGLDVLVIDHHEPADTLPDAVAIVDPKRHDATYPERELAAVGLCFKVATAVAQRLDVQQRFVEDAFLDLVALGTIADVVPLVGENRILAYHGLRSLAKTGKAGLRALMRLCRVEGQVRASDVSFRLAPRMNAAGRMGDATDALELLLTEDEDDATRLALQLENINRERQREQEDTYRDALRIVDEQADLENDRVLVLVSPDWHIGVVGIVASKILEQYGRPTILLVADGEEARGSARSIDEFDIAGGLAACSDALIRYGGHALAAGLTIDLNNIDALRARINSIAAETMTAGGVAPQPRIDAELLLDEIDGELIEGLWALEPCGQANPDPIFLTRGVNVLETRTVGRDNQHLKLFVDQGDRPVDCIGFGLGHESDWLRRGMTIDICHSPEINDYNGTRGIQLRLDAVRRAEDGE